MSSWEVGQSGSLRERKKAKTRAAIQDAALRLYLEQGYDATTTEQIAAAADISPSTFFRYFPTKAETVLYDRLDPVLLEALEKQPLELTPAAAIRVTLREIMGQLDPTEAELEQTRWRLVAEVPELRSAVLDRTFPMAGLLAEAVARRTGRDPGDLEVLSWTGAMIGVLFVTYFTAIARGETDPLELFDEALAHLDAGLPL